MNIKIFGKISKAEKDYLKKVGFKINLPIPDFVFVFGGDGSLMKAEQKYPKVPKVIIKKSKICKKCPKLSFKKIVSKIKNKNFEIKKFYKLEAESKNKKILGINDIVIHNGNPRHAIRYSVAIKDIDFYKEAIGDGVVVATSFGATGYFRSITDSIFYVGTGLAFNNSTESIDHMVINENSEIKIKITRGPAECYADNNPRRMLLKEGQTVVVRKSKEEFNFVSFYN